MKQRVHNELEAKVLIEEAFSQGTEDQYDGSAFYTHDEKLLFVCRIDLVGYYRDLPNGDSIYKEL
ncbi:MAG TPA: hypothetical protein DDY18_09020 [Flavobacterium sp.]|jgi:hypothetical protein|nr:hypothetical protein [Flavobacterium sp.]